MKKHLFLLFFLPILMAATTFDSKTSTTTESYESGVYKLMEVIDNFLPEHDFVSLCSVIMSPAMPWYYAPYVATDGLINSNGHYFHNIFIEGEVKNDALFHLVNRIVEPMGVGDDIFRMRLISFPRTSEIFHHETHQDASLSHTSLLMYMNTNNGFTNHDSGEQVKSVANRALIHDPSKPHNSTTCTDAQRRVVLTINYL